MMGLGNGLISNISNVFCSIAVHIAFNGRSFTEIANGPSSYSASASQAENVYDTNTDTRGSHVMKATD